MRYLAKGRDFYDLFRGRVSLNFDLVISQLNHFMPLYGGPVHLCQFNASKSVTFSKYRVYNFVTDGRTDGRTGRKHYAFGQSRLTEVHKF